MNLPDPLLPYADRTITLAEAYALMRETMQGRFEFLGGALDEQADNDMDFCEGEASGVRYALWALLDHFLNVDAGSGLDREAFDVALDMWNAQGLEFWAKRDPVTGRTVDMEALL